MARFKGPATRVPVDIPGLGPGVAIVPKSLSDKPTARDFPGRRGGGGGTLIEDIEEFQRQEAARRAAEAKRLAEEKAEAERKVKLTADQKAREDAIQRQREQAERRRLEKEKVIAFEQRLREMNAQQKQQFFREQAEARRISNLQKLESQGKRLTTEAKATLEKARTDFFKNINEIQRSLPSGDKLLFDKKTFSIQGIESSTLGRSIPFTEEGVAFYNEKIKEKGISDIFKPITTEKKPSIIRGLQKLRAEIIKPEEIKREEEVKLERLVERLGEKVKAGEKIDISEELAKVISEEKDIPKLEKAIGGTIGLFAPIPGAILWAVGDSQTKVRDSVGDGEKITRSEFKNIVLDSATKGAILGFAMKGLGLLSNIAGKRIITGAAIRNTENAAVQSALNHGGQVIKVSGKAGKNFIQTYFYKDMLGNVFDVTLDVKNNRLNDALRKSIETGSAVGGYIGGSKLGTKVTQGSVFSVGKLRGNIPEDFQKKTQLDIMARQLLRDGKIFLTRRGVYQTGKGISPRQDAWLDSKIKNPTKSIFWRFDKTLSKKDQAISPLPHFTKEGSGYWKMFRANWNKNKGMSPLKRYIVTTAETPLLEDVLIVRILNMKDIKNVALRKKIIKEYATTGKLTKSTQNEVLKNNLPISDKNREFGFHDENEFVTRTGFKLKGRKDISWTFDSLNQEFIPVIQEIKGSNRLKNYLSILQKKKIITRTDAQFIKDNYAIKTKFKEGSILPKEHSYEHMKNVERNIVKLMDKYPEFNRYWIKRYGSIPNAKTQMKRAMWHDIGKAEPGSEAFGTSHGEKVWRVWKAGLLPKDLKLSRGVAKAIKVHETLDPRKLFFKVKNRIKLITPEEKIVATADRLDLPRVGIKIDPKRLPLPDAMKRLNIKLTFKNYPSRFNSIINKIKLDRRVTKADIRKLLSWRPKKLKEVIKKKLIKKKEIKKIRRKVVRKKPKIRRVPKRPSKERPSERKPSRPVSRRPTRPVPRPPKRPTTRPPARPTPRKITTKRRPPKRPTIRPIRRPPKRPPKKPGTFLFELGTGTKVLSKPTMTYFVVVKSRGKFVKVPTPPLLLNDARDVLAYKLDKRLVRTSKIVPAGMKKNVGVLKKSVKGYFIKNRKKFRPFKIKKGVKKKLVRGYIERKKYVGDTKSELLELKLEKQRATKKAKIIKKNKVIKKSIRRSKSKSQKKTKQKKVVKKKSLKNQKKRKSKKSKKKKK